MVSFGVGMGASIQSYHSCNSDIHGAIYEENPIHTGTYRPLTLIFSRSRTFDDIKEALLERRTAVLYDGKVIGCDDWFRKLFHSSVQMTPWPLLLNESKKTIWLENLSDLDEVLQPTSQSVAMDVICPVLLPARSSVLVTVKLKTDKIKKTQ